MLDRTTIRCEGGCLIPVRLTRALRPAVCAVALAACLLPGGQRVQPIAGGRGVVITSPQTPNLGLSRKRVTTKQEPDLLIAEDGTSCRVSRDRYQEVEVGSEQLCGWQ